MKYLTTVSAVLLSLVLAFGQSSTIYPILPPFPGNASVYLNGSGAFSTPAGGGGSAPVGTVVATGTPNVGDLLSAADASGTNGVWSAKIWTTNDTVFTDGPAVTLIDKTRFLALGQLNFFGVPPEQHGFLFSDTVFTNALADAQAWQGIVSEVQLKPISGGTGLGAYAASLTVSTHPTDTNHWYGVQMLGGYAEHTGPGIVDNLVGSVMNVYHSGSGTVDRAMGAWIQVYGDGAKTTNGYGINIENVSDVQNAYGISIADIASGSASNYAIKTGLGQVSFGDAVSSSSLISASTGFKSLAADATVSIASTGWTNSFGKAAVVRFDGTAMTYTVYDNAGTSLYTNAVSVGHSTELLQTGAKLIITAGTGVSGRASPF